MARLNHPHIAMIYHTGLHNEQPYLVMELLAGRELDEVRQESFSFTAKEVAQVIGQAASALDPEAAWATGTGFVLMAPGGRLGAVSQCRLAVDLLPEDADVQNAMGIVLATRGEVAEALGHFREAVRLAPDQAVFQANLERAQLDPRVSGLDAGEGSGD